MHVTEENTLKELINLEYSKDLKRFARILKQRTEGDWDAVAAVTGEEGVGKSTLAMNLGAIIDKNFDLEKNMLFQPKAEEMHKKLIGLPKGSVIVPDEAIRILYKHDWHTAGQKYLNKLFALARKENKIVLLCIPRFHDLNEYFRNWRVKFWIHVYKRGKAVVLVRDSNPLIRDPFHMKTNQRTLYTKIGHKMINEEIVINVFKKYFPNYHTHFDFPNLTEEKKQYYLELKNKYAYLDLTLDKEEGWKYKLGMLQTFLTKTFGFGGVQQSEIIHEPHGTIATRVSLCWATLPEETLKIWQRSFLRWGNKPSTKRRLGIDIATSPSHESNNINNLKKTEESFEKKRKDEDLHKGFAL